MKTYVIDLDGTLCHTQGMDYQNATPRRDIIAAVNRLARAGHRIVIDTARGSLSGVDWRDLTHYQLHAWGVRYHKLWCGGKIPADHYVDDRALRPEELLRGKR